MTTSVFANTLQLVFVSANHSENDLALLILDSPFRLIHLYDKGVCFPLSFKLSVSVKRQTLTLVIKAVSQHLADCAEVLIEALKTRPQMQVGVVDAGVVLTYKRIDSC